MGNGFSRDFFSIAPYGARHILWTLLTLLFLLGLYSSLKVVLGTFGIEPDTVHSLMLWHGINEHGIAWVKDWIFTQDNWLFSLVPIHFLEFSLFGANPEFLVVTGWLIFVFSTIAAGFIAKELKAKHSFYIVPVVLLFSGLYAHKYGLASYSTSHNITNLFGLFSILALLKWCRHKHHTALVLLFLLITAGGLSDPWMLPSYTLPIGLVGIAYIFQGASSQDKVAGFFLALAMAISILLVKTQAFGLLDFLPQMEFSIGNWEAIRSNFTFLVKDLGRLLNIIPGHDSSEWIRSNASLIIVFSLYASGIWFAIHNTVNGPIRDFFYLTIFSFGGISLALLISSTAATDNSARFLINILYLIAISIAVSLERNWNAIPVILRFISATIAVMFVVTGLLSTQHLLSRPGLYVKVTRHQALLEYLKEHKLNYGYGAYWGTAANALTALSNSEIKVRPIQFDHTLGTPVFGRRPETSKHWYTIEDLPPDQSTFFVIVSHDVEECPVPRICREGLISKYGPPENLLRYKHYEILVWKKPLISANPGEFISTRMNEEIFFDASNSMPDWKGWSEPESEGTWSTGNSSSVKLLLSTIPKHDILLVVRGRALLSDNLRMQEIPVSINNKHVSTLRYTWPASDQLREIYIPRGLIVEGDGKLSIHFRYNHATSPAELALNNDKRQLALYLSSIILKPHRQTLRQ